MTSDPKDLDDRITKLENGYFNCFISSVCFSLTMTFLTVWAFLWTSGCTDVKSPIMPDRIPFKEWKERNNPTQHVKE